MNQYQSENITDLAKVLLKVQRTVQPVTKDAENPFTKSWYASLNSVMRGHLHHTSSVAKPCVHLQVFHNQSGKKQDGKFWIGEASPVGLTLKWGKPDTVGQQHFIPAENCEGKNTVMELEARAAKKLTEGYSLNTTKSSI